MKIEAVQEPMPLRTDAHGIIRVGGTRVTLDTLVAAYREGATAEEIAEQYPSVSLADVYASLSYYLRHRSDLEAYFTGGAADAERVRAESQARHGAWPDLRRRLAERRSR